MTKYKYSDEEFSEAVRNSVSMKNLIGLLGMCYSSWNYKSFYKRIQQLGLSLDHWKGQTHQDISGCLRRSLVIPLDSILVENSTTGGSVLRRSIIRSKVLEYKCAVCNISEWNNKPLVLQLDHKNGCRTDNRIENLRWLCPNCHTQTETWGMKNRRKRCVDCNKQLSTKRANRCRKCSGFACQKSKIIWPSITELFDMIEKASYCAVGRLLGVSDNAIRKHIKKHLSRARVA